MLYIRMDMGGLRTSTNRLTKQNAAFLGVSLVILGLLLGPLWPSMCDMPIQDSDEVGETKKPLYIWIFLQEGCKQTLRGGQSKMQ